MNAQEKKVIREKFPDVFITRTMKHDSKRKHYYVVETPGVMRCLAELRGEPCKPKRNDRDRRSRSNFQDAYARRYE